MFYIEADGFSIKGVTSIDSSTHNNTVNDITIEWFAK